MKQNIDSECGVFKGTPEPVSLICFLEYYQSIKKIISLITTAKQISNKIILFNSNLVIPKATKLKYSRT